MAEFALSQSACQDLFNTDNYDPSEVLADMMAGPVALGGNFGTVSSESINQTFSAETRYGNGQWVGQQPNQTYVYTTANIVLQATGPNAWWAQSAQSVAATLIHELGHAYNIVASLGGSLIQNERNPDGSVNMSLEAANAATLKPCTDAIAGYTP
jgi:predicted Zn-dependent protease with MMP-like domain